MSVTTRSQVCAQTATKLRRYPFRALVLGLIPPGIATFYLLIYLKWLKPETSFNKIETGPSNASLVFYGWFIISVFGLTLGEYGLTGSEAGMLMTRSGRTPHGGHILLHADKTWTGLGGWAKAVKVFWTWRSLPSRTWTILAMTTLVSYVAFPLSGLTMELKNGYVLGSQPAVVYGVNSSTFPVLQAYNAMWHARMAWATGRLEKPPGRSVIYTAEPRDEPLTDLSTEAMPLIFVAPQADEIVSGRVWGLAAQYNCSVVERLQDFVVYKRRNETVEYGLGWVLAEDRYKPWEGPTFDFFNWTEFPGPKVAAKLEMATSVDYVGIHTDPWSYRQGSVTGMDDNGKAIQFYRDYPGLDKPAVIELALWQVMDRESASLWPGVSLNLGRTISDLFDTTGESNLTTRGFPVPAIGVSCFCASAIGEADVDGFTHTFSNFKHDKGTVVIDEETRRKEVPLTLANVAYRTPGSSIINEEGNWVERLFASVHADGVIGLVDNRNITRDDMVVLPRLLTSEDLRRSMIQLFGSYTQQLIYRGYQTAAAKGDTSGETNLAWTHPSLFAAEETSVLGRGILNPLVAVSLLFLWAAVCLFLALCYGFQRRWAETVDGFSVIRFGTDAVGSGLYDFATDPITREMAHAPWLGKMPGMVGDLRPGYDPGYIGLSEVEIDKRKEYI